MPKQMEISKSGVYIIQDPVYSDVYISAHDVHIFGGDLIYGEVTTIDNITNFKMEGMHGILIKIGWINQEKIEKHIYHY